MLKISFGKQVSSRMIGDLFIYCFGWQVLFDYDRLSGGVLLRVVIALLHYWWSGVGKAITHELRYILLAGKRSLARDL